MLMFSAGAPARVLLLPGDGIGPEVTAAAARVCASAIEAAVDGALVSGIVTPDLGGTSSTEEVTWAVIARLDGLAATRLKSNSVDI
jgi:isocitrate/isopropylmalate dehydrogenase